MTILTPWDNSMIFFFSKLKVVYYGLCVGGTMQLQPEIKLLANI